MASSLARVVMAGLPRSLPAPRGSTGRAESAAYGPNPTEAQQNEYAPWEVSPDGPYASVGAQLKQAKPPQEAAAIWTKGFESPANADAKAVARAAVAPRYVGYGLPAPKVAVTAAPLNPNAGPRVGAVPPATPTASAPPPTVTGQADDAARHPLPRPRPR